jgi:CARDB
MSAAAVAAIGGAGLLAVALPASAAPVVTIVINDGAAKTNRALVTLTLSYVDSEHGVKDMRVSLDGTMDTEPFIATTSSLDVTLPGSDGVKTVKFQARDNLNQVSTVQSDTIQLDRRPDLRVTALSNPPVVKQHGGTFSVNETTRNVGLSRQAGASRTRYWFSLDAVKGPGDIQLAAVHMVPILQPQTQHAANKTLTVPSTTPYGIYRLIACADAGGVISEYNETNNCRVAASSITIQVPDLTMISVSNPPASRARGQSFSLDATVQNIGNLTAPASTSRYYLSLDQTKGPGDQLLTGATAVGAIADGGIWSDTLNVTIPAGATTGQFYVVGCADNPNAISESSESNNCDSSTTKITVT